MRRSLIVFLKDLHDVETSGGEHSRDVVVVIYPGAEANLSEVEGFILYKLHGHIALALKGEE